MGAALQSWFGGGEEILSSLPRNGFEEKNVGVTDAPDFTPARPGALPTELLGIAPKAGLEPATPAFHAK